MKGTTRFCPSLLELREKKTVQGATICTIVAKENISVGTTFGLGSNVKDEKSCLWSQSCVKQETDGKKEDTQNWVLSVHRSSSITDQNTVSVQSHGHCFITVFKNIEKGEQLVLPSYENLTESLADEKLPNKPRRSSGIANVTCYRCFRCNAVFLNLKRLGQHLYHWCRHQKVENVPTPSLGDIPSQIRQGIPFQAFQCRTCLMLFICKDTVMKHILGCCNLRTVSRKRDSCSGKGAQNYCGVCGTFAGPNAIRHERVHFSWDSFICEICGKVIPRRDKYFEHKATHNCVIQQRKSNTPGRPSKKDEEASEYTTGKGAKKHTVSAKNKIFKCSFCEKAFAYRHILQRHELLHSGESYQCDLCGNAFKREDRLAEHRRRNHSDQ